MDYEEQYDKIYRYCYFRLKNPAVAEDITQETFLRFIENDTYKESGKGLQYLYTIARNLCIDEYRKRGTEELTDEIAVEGFEETVTDAVAMRQALKALDAEERELVLLRFVNEVPVNVICRVFDCSRFALNRRMKQIVKKLRKEAGYET